MARTTNWMPRWNWLFVSLAAILLNLLLVAIANKDQIFVSFYKLEHLTTTNIYANKHPVQLIKAFFHKLDLILIIQAEERRHFFFFFISRTKKGKKRKTEQDVNARKLVELHIHVSQNLNYWSSDSKGLMRLMKF